MNPSVPLLQVQGLTVDYMTANGAVRAVDSLSFGIDRGRIVGLAGESGSGKSTAAMALLRMLPPPAVIRGGSIVFDGEEVLDMDARSLRAFRWKRASLVLQSAMNALNPILTVEAQITDVIRAHEPIANAAAKQRALELMQLIGIDPAHLGSYPHQLSGGMRQRIGIAIALALQPQLLIMDEPTTALDVVVQREILHEILELKRRLGFAILFITHDLNLMLQLCDSIGILYAGKMAEFAPARAILSRAQHPYTRGLLASFPELSEHKTRLAGIRGTPPDMAHPPSGCRFHPRCSEATQECRKQEPELSWLAPRHHAACLYRAPYVPRSRSGRLDD